MNSMIKNSAFGLLLVGITSASVFAAEPETKTVNAAKPTVVERVKNQETKNEAALKSGKITEAQAKKLNDADESVRKEAEESAQKNGGKLSKEENRELNQKENKINHKRARMEKRNAKKAQSSQRVIHTQVKSS